MSRSRTSRRAALPIVVLATAALLLAACGSDDQPSASPGTTAGAGTTIPAPGTTIAAGNAALQKFDKLVQQQLKDVACYAGAIDGILGPQTDAAIVAFQTASGITVDGEIGPQTEAALAKDTAAKKIVCVATPGTTVAPTTTTTKPPTPTDPPCSATALAKTLPSGLVINTFVCSDVYAGVQGTANGQTDYYVLDWKSQNGTLQWVLIQPCGAASAGIPPQVLAVGCKPS